MTQRQRMPGDPVRASELESAMAHPLVEELLQEIVTSPAPLISETIVSWRQRSPRPILLVGTAMLVVLAIVVPLAVNASSGLSHATTTPFRAGHPFRPSSKGSAPRTASGRWQLVSAVSVISGSWQQNTAGPPPGTLTCSSTGTCYVLAGKYASPKANSPLLSEALYVTNDFGLHWLVLPMPSGFSPSTLLSCPGSSVCAAGGALNGQPILITTADGGHQWTMTPLTNVSGGLVQLSCLSASACHGITGPASDAYGQGLRPGVVPNEQFVSTNDAGVHWVTSALPTGDAVDAFVCPDVDHCLVMGTESNGNGDVFGEPAFSLITSDGGATWSNGSVPAGFTVSSYGGLSCADDEHCLVEGTIPIKVKNPPQCASAPFQGPAGSRISSAPTIPPSPAVEKVAGPEGVIARKGNDQEAAQGGGFSCSPNETQYISDIASTTDGGRSWTPELLPADVPSPQLDSIACTSATVCWASGSETVLIKVGNAVDDGSAMLLGTTDGGSTWSKVTFSVPSGAPNPYGQSYLSMGSISCPATNACLALGAAAQSAATAPVYSFVSTAPL